MSTYLLDANVLIALMAREHVHHERVKHWAADVSSFALCPIVEGAFLRFAIRLGASTAEAVQALRVVRERRGYQFWPDAVSYADVALGHVRGHRQVTDAYLASLARAHSGARLATLDRGLANDLPDCTILIPAAGY